MESLWSTGLHTSRTCCCPRWAQRSQSFRHVAYRAAAPQTGGLCRTRSSQVTSSMGSKNADHAARTDASATASSAPAGPDLQEDVRRQPGRSAVLRMVTTGLGGAVGQAALQMLLGADAVNAMETPRPAAGQVFMRTLSDSELSVSVYPTFAYNSLGGGGLAVARTEGSRINLLFDPTSVNIPAVSARTAKILGVPMLPGMRIEVVPAKLEGWIDRDTGEVQLDFVANFNFSADLPRYSARPLFVRTLLTTEGAQGEQLGGTGSRLDSAGFARLVGVARLVPTDDPFMDKFLQLPADCKAVMSAQFIFPESL